jgi:glycosyltransferase involved in cell wall biosynthesis
VTGSPPNAHARPLRVLLWGPLPPPQGGVAQWMCHYLQAAERAGLQVVVVNTAPGLGTFAEHSQFRLGRLRVALIAYHEAFALLARRQVDVAHVCSTGFWAHGRDAVLLAACRAAGVPAVLHLHASTQIIGWRASMSPLVRRAYDASLQLPAAILTLSTELAEALRVAAPGQRVERVWNPVDVSSAADAAVGSATSDRRRVLFVGAMLPKKGVAELAEALLPLYETELMCIGWAATTDDPQAEARMAAALEQLDAAGRLMRLGEQPREAVLAAMRTADLLCLPSHQEGLPNVLLEALASGLPAVATPVGGIVDLASAVVVDAAASVQPLTLVPVGDVVALRAAIAQVLAQPAAARQAGAHGQRWAQSHVGADVVLAGFVALYRSLLATSQG